MSIEVQAVQAVRAFSEATFGADSSGSLGSYTYLPLRDGSAQLTLTRDSLADAALVQHIDEYREEVLGKRSATIAITMNLAPTGTAAASAVAAVTGGLGMMLKACLGGEYKGTGTTFSSGSTAVVLNLTSAAGFSVGSAIGWVNASGVLETREIKTIATNVVTLKLAFSGSPANLDVAYAVATYYPTANPAESLAMLVEGLESDDRWLLTGGQAVGGVTLAFDVTGQTLPSVTFNLQFARFYAAGETSTPITGTLATATYTNYEPIVGEAGDFRVWTCGSPTLVSGTAVNCSALSFTPALGFAPYTSPMGVMTIKKWVKTRTAPIMSGNWVNPYEDVTWWTARNSRTNKAVAYQFGTAAGSTALITAPTVQIVNPQRTADAGSLAAQTVSWKGRRDTDTTVLTTDIAYAPFRIHLA
jgi:hypothetical protein